MTWISEYDLVPIRYYDDPLEAHLARCLLENEGLEAFVHDEHIIGLNRMFSYALGGIKLKVKEGDKAEALHLLEEIEHRPFLDEHDHALQCPRCGSEDLMTGILKPRTTSGIFHWLVGLLLAVYPLTIDRSMGCNQCGHHFRPPA